MRLEKETRPSRQARGRETELTTLEEILSLTPAQFLGAVASAAAFLAIPAIASLVYSGVAL